MGKKKSFVGANVERELERSSYARSFVPFSFLGARTYLRRVTRSERTVSCVPDGGVLLLSSALSRLLSIVVLSLEEPRARSAGNANEAFERPRVSLGSPSAPVSRTVPNRPDERSATGGPTHGRLRAPAARRRGALDLAAVRRRRR